MMGNDTRHCRLTDVVEARHVSAGLTAGAGALNDLAPLSRIQLLGPAAHAPLSSSNRQPC